MAPSLRSAWRNIWQTLSSIKTGVVLIILVVIFSAAGTVILQRPMTDPDDVQRAYSPAMLRFLDVTGLTDVFHTRWFIGLMILVSCSIIAASLRSCSVTSWPACANNNACHAPAMPAPITETGDSPLAATGHCPRWCELWYIPVPSPA